MAFFRDPSATLQLTLSLAVGSIIVDSTLVIFEQ